jgi:hypothetical protein
MNQPSSLFPHPTAAAASTGADAHAHAQAGDDRFVDVEHTMTEDAGWHFELPLLEDSTLITTSREAPIRGGGPHTLACFASPDGRAQFEVSGVALNDEIDAADWLEATLTEAEREIVSRTHVPTAAGWVGDVLAIWQHDEVDYVGRFFAVKWGARMFVLGCSCPAASYADFADDFFECLTGFAPLLAAGRVYAEETHAIDYDSPLPWSAVLPASWGFVRHEPNDDGAYFEAEHGTAERYDEDSGEIDGKLALAMVPRSLAKRPRDASKLYLDALKQAGFEIEAENFESEEPSEPFTQCWYMSSAVERDEARGQLHCRVAMHDAVWLIGGVVGPDRNDDAGAWMRNKRALDVACSTVSLDPPAAGGRP